MNSEELYHVDVQTPNHSLIAGDRTGMSALGVVDQRQLTNKSKLVVFVFAQSLLVTLL